MLIAYQNVINQRIRQPKLDKESKGRAVARPFEKIHTKEKN
jgi:hypothetical protein